MYFREAVTAGQRTAFRFYFLFYTVVNSASERSSALLAAELSVEKVFSLLFVISHIHLNKSNNKLSELS